MTFIAIPCYIFILLPSRSFCLLKISYCWSLTWWVRWTMPLLASSCEWSHKKYILLHKKWSFHEGCFQYMWPDLQVLLKKFVMKTLFFVQCLLLLLNYESELNLLLLIFSLIRYFSPAYFTVFNFFLFM